MAKPSRSSNLIVLATVLYGLAISIYGLYSSITAQGFAGYLITKQMDWFGGASITLTYCIFLVVFGLIPYLFAAMIGVTVWPALGEAMFGNTKPQAPRAVPKPPPAPLRWSTIGKTAIVMFGFTGALSSILYFLNVREQNLGVYKLDLDHSPASLPGRLGFVQLTGHLDRPHALSYSDKNSVYLILPVTEASWKAGNPLHYFLKYEQQGSPGAKLSLPPVFRQPGAADFTGRFSGRLPAFVQSDYRKKGLSLAPDYRILEYESISTTGSPMSQSHLFALVLGGVISFTLSAVMIRVKYMKPKPLST